MRKRRTQKEKRHEDTEALVTSHAAAELHQRPESIKHVGSRQQYLFCAHHRKPMCMRDSNKFLNARKKPTYHWTAGYSHLWPMA